MQTAALHMAKEYASKQNMAASHGRAWRLLPASLITLLILVMAAGFCVYAEDELPDNGIPVVYVKVDETGENPTVEEMLD